MQAFARKKANFAEIMMKTKSKISPVILRRLRAESDQSTSPTSTKTFSTLQECRDINNVKIIIITGQTATGKTKLALELAQKYKGELINCDSRQIYKHLDIITGKDLIDKKFFLDNKVNAFDIGYYNTSPLFHCSIVSLLNKNSNEAMKQLNHNVPIWLYDIIDPKAYFSSFDYAKCALYVIKKMLKQNKTPIIVGGTYLYLYHLLYGIETENIQPNWKLRKELEKKTINELQTILKKIAPQLVRQLNHSDLNNPQRLMRKIEIASNRRGVLQYAPTLKFQLKPFFQNYQIEFVGLHFKNREKLKQAITSRVEDRLEKGAVQEVKNLLNKGYSQTDPGLKTIGVYQIIQFLKGQISKQEAINQWTTREMQYAKRQYAFMKKDSHIIWHSI